MPSPVCQIWQNNWMPTNKNIQSVPPKTHQQTGGLEKKTPTRTKKTNLKRAKKKHGTNSGGSGPGAGGDGLQAPESRVCLVCVCSTVEFPAERSRLAIQSVFAICHKSPQIWGELAPKASFWQKASSVREGRVIKCHKWDEASWLNGLFPRQRAHTRLGFLCMRHIFFPTINLFLGVLGGGCVWTEQRKHLI